MSIDGLPRGPRALVYLRIVDQLKTDPVLSRVVQTWQTYDGDMSQKLPGVIPLTPLVRLLPQLGPSSWYSPDGLISDLVVRVEMFLAGYDVADCLDLQDVFERAIYPLNDRAKQLEFERQLQVRTNTGQITFSQPTSVQPIGEDSRPIMYSSGAFSISVTRFFNP